MYCLVCTGGIGSGKSYAVRIFSRLGIPSYIADSRAKELYDTDKSLLEELVKLLGPEIVRLGKLDRKAVAAKIFSNKELLEKVNNIVHPRVLRDFNEWKERREDEGAEIIIFESAIFFESPIFHHIADKVIVVTAPENVRINRVVKRDKISVEQVKQRILSQSNDEEKIKGADYIITTDGKKAVLPQILKIIELIKQKEN